MHPTKTSLLVRYPKEISVKVYQGLLYTRLRVLILRWEMTQVIFFLQKFISDRSAKQ